MPVVMAIEMLPPLRVEEELSSPERKMSEELSKEMEPA